MILGARDAFAYAPQVPLRVAQAYPQVRFTLPGSTASIDDGFAPESGISRPPQVILFQDAHTNASAQFNLAKALDRVVRAEGVTRVLVEGGWGDCSLGGLKRAADPSRLREAAARAVRGGMLHGEEYLSLASDLEFAILGAESRDAYERGLKAYAAAVRQRTEALSYLDRIRRGLADQEESVFSQELAAFETRRELYHAGDLSFADWYGTLMAQARKQGIYTGNYRSLSSVRRVTVMERVIDFERVEREELLAVSALGSDERDELQRLRSAAPAERKGATDLDRVRPMFFLLEEKAGRALRAYPELTKYIRYLRESRKISAPTVLAELAGLEEAVLDRLASSPMEDLLIRLKDSASLLEKLIRLQITPEEYRRLVRLSGLADADHLSGFVNARILEREAGYEGAIQLKKSLTRADRAAKRFYAAASERDALFLDAVQRQLDLDPSRPAVLITGGFHTFALKEALRRRGISFISILPTVHEPTDQARYERILLASLEPPSSFAPQDGASSAGRTRAAGQRTLPLALDPAALRQLAAESSATAGSAARMAEGGQIRRTIAGLPDTEAARSFSGNEGMIYDALAGHIQRSLGVKVIWTRSAAAVKGREFELIVQGGPDEALRTEIADLFEAAVRDDGLIRSALDAYVRAGSLEATIFGIGQMGGYKARIDDLGTRYGSVTAIHRYRKETGVMTVSRTVLADKDQPFELHNRPSAKLFRVHESARQYGFNVVLETKDTGDVVSLEHPLQLAGLFLRSGDRVILEVTGAHPVPELEKMWHVFADLLADHDTLEGLNRMEVPAGPVPGEPDPGLLPYLDRVREIGAGSRMASSSTAPDRGFGWRGALGALLAGLSTLVFPEFFKAVLSLGGVFDHHYVWALMLGSYYANARFELHRLSRNDPDAMDPVRLKARLGLFAFFLSGVEISAVEAVHYLADETLYRPFCIKLNGAMLFLTAIGYLRAHSIETRLLERAGKSSDGARMAAVDERIRTAVVPDESYDVVLTRAVFDPVNPLLKTEIRGRKAFFVIDRGMGEENVGQLQRYLSDHGLSDSGFSNVLYVSGGERLKNGLWGLLRVIWINYKAWKAGLDRKSVFVIVGGGATIDMAGFAASVFHRGADHIRIPTTLLAQDDAGIGVKNGINLFGQKNFFGVFQPPQSVIVDPLLLKHAPRALMSAGLAEIIKVTLMKDAAGFELLEKDHAALLDLPAALRGELDLSADELEDLIQRAEALIAISVRDHLGQIGTDPFEKKLARPLDYGHQWAHRLEVLTRHRLSHGQAVAIGTAIDSHISWKRGYITGQEFDRILRLIRSAGLPVHDVAAKTDALWAGMEDFRKHLGGELTISLLGEAGAPADSEGIGKKQDVHDISKHELDLALRYLSRWGTPSGARMGSVVLPVHVIIRDIHSRPSGRVSMLSHKASFVGIDFWIRSLDRNGKVEASVRATDRMGVEDLGLYPEIEGSEAWPASRIQVRVDGAYPDEVLVEAGKVLIDLLDDEGTLEGHKELTEYEKRIEEIANRRPPQTGARMADRSVDEIDSLMRDKGFPELVRHWERFKAFGVPLSDLDGGEIFQRRDRHMGVFISNRWTGFLYIAASAWLGSEYYELFIDPGIEQSALGLLLKSLSMINANILIGQAILWIARTWVRPMEKIMAMDVAWMLKQRDYRAAFDSSESAKKVTDRLRRSGVSAVWDDPDYAATYRTDAKGKVVRYAAESNSDATRRILKDLIGSLKDRNYTPGRLFSSLLQGKNSVTQVVKLHGQQIRSRQSADWSDEEAAAILTEMRDQWVKPGSAGYQELDRLIRRIGGDFAEEGAITAEIWKRDPWSDLTHQEEFYSSASLRGVKPLGRGTKGRLGTFGYLRNKSISALDIRVNGKRKVRVRMSAAVRVDGNGGEVPLLYVDGAEGSNAVKPAVIRTAVEDYAKACGFDLVFYNGRPLNKIPRRFADSLAEEGLAETAFRIEYLDASHREYLDGFGAPLQPFEYAFPKGTVIGYAVSMDPASPAVFPPPSRAQRVSRWMRSNILNLVVASALIYSTIVIGCADPRYLIPLGVVTAAALVLHIRLQNRSLNDRSSADRRIEPLSGARLSVWNRLSHWIRSGVWVSAFLGSVAPPASGEAPRSSERGQAEVRSADKAYDAETIIDLVGRALDPSKPVLLMGDAIDPKGAARLRTAVRAVEETIPDVALVPSSSYQEWLRRPDNAALFRDLVMYLLISSTSEAYRTGSEEVTFPYTAGALIAILENIGSPAVDRWWSVLAEDVETSLGGLLDRTGLNGTAGMKRAVLLAELLKKGLEPDPSDLFLATRKDGEIGRMKLPDTWQAKILANPLLLAKLHLFHHFTQPFGAHALLRSDPAKASAMSGLSFMTALELYERPVRGYWVADLLNQSDQLRADLSYSDYRRFKSISEALWALSVEREPRPALALPAVDPGQEAAVRNAAERLRRAAYPLEKLHLAAQAYRRIGVLDASERAALDKLTPLVLGKLAADWPELERSMAALQRMSARSKPAHPLNGDVRLLEKAYEGLTSEKKRVLDLLPSEVVKRSYPSGARMANDRHLRVLESIVRELGLIKEMRDWRPAVTVFGSARIPAGNPFYQLAFDLGHELGALEIAGRTGAGPSIMEAVLEGIHSARPDRPDLRQGIRIKLPFEQETSSMVGPMILFDHFLTRKRALDENVIATVALPGGIGSMDEFFEAMRRGRPLALLGERFWWPIWDAYFDAWKRSGLIEPFIDGRRQRPFITDRVSTVIDLVRNSQHVAEHQQHFVTSPDRIDRLAEDLRTGYLQLHGWPQAVTIVGHPAPTSPLLVEAERLAGLLWGSGVSVRVASENGLDRRLWERAQADRKEDLFQSVIFQSDRTLPVRFGIQPHIPEDRRILVRDESLHQFLTAAHSSAFVFLPGGLGTMNRLFDIVQLMQVNKVEKQPIILLGRDHWTPIIETLKKIWIGTEGLPPMVSPEDMSLFRIVDTAEEAMRELDRPLQSDGARMAVSSSAGIAFQNLQAAKLQLGLAIAAHVKKAKGDFNLYLLRREDEHKVRQMETLGHRLMHRQVAKADASRSRSRVLGVSAGLGAASVGLWLLSAPWSAAWPLVLLAGFLGHQTAGFFWKIKGYKNFLDNPPYVDSLVRLERALVPLTDAGKLDRSRIDRALMILAELSSAAADQDRVVLSNIEAALYSLRSPRSGARMAVETSLAILARDPGKPADWTGIRTDYQRLETIWREAERAPGEEGEALKRTVARCSALFKKPFFDESSMKGPWVIWGKTALFLANYEYALAEGMRPHEPSTVPVDLPSVQGRDPGSAEEALRAWFRASWVKNGYFETPAPMDVGITAAGKIFEDGVDLGQVQLVQKAGLEPDLAASHLAEWILRRGSRAVRSVRVSGAGTGGTAALRIELAEPLVDTWKNLSVRDLRVVLFESGPAERPLEADEYAPYLLTPETDAVDRSIAADHLVRHLREGRSVIAGGYQLYTVKGARKMGEFFGQTANERTALESFYRFYLASVSAGGNNNSVGTPRSERYELLRSGVWTDPALHLEPAREVLTALGSNDFLISDKTLEHILKRTVRSEEAMRAVAKMFWAQEGMKPEDPSVMAAWNFLVLRSLMGSARSKDLPTEFIRDRWSRSILKGMSVSTVGYQQPGSSATASVATAARTLVVKDRQEWLDEVWGILFSTISLTVLPKDQPVLLTTGEGGFTLKAILDELQRIDSGSAEPVKQDLFAVEPLDLGALRNAANLEPAARRVAAAVREAVFGDAARVEAETRTARVRHTYQALFRSAEDAARGRIHAAVTAVRELSQDEAVNESLGENFGFYIAQLEFALQTQRGSDSGARMAQSDQERVKIFYESLGSAAAGLVPDARMTLVADAFLPTIATHDLQGDHYVAPPYWREQWLGRAVVPGGTPRSAVMIELILGSRHKPSRFFELLSHSYDEIFGVPRTAGWNMDLQAMTQNAQLLTALTVFLKERSGPFPEFRAPLLMLTPKINKTLEEYLASDLGGDLETRHALLIYLTGLAGALGETARETTLDLTLPVYNYAITRDAKKHVNLRSAAVIKSLNRRINSALERKDPVLLAHWLGLMEERFADIVDRDERIGIFASFAGIPRASAERVASANAGRIPEFREWLFSSFDGRTRPRSKDWSVHEILRKMLQLQDKLGVEVYWAFIETWGFAAVSRWVMLRQYDTFEESVLGLASASRRWNPDQIRTPHPDRPVQRAAVKARALHAALAGMERLEARPDEPDRMRSYLRLLAASGLDQDVLFRTVFYAAFPDPEDLAASAYEFVSKSRLTGIPRMRALYLSPESKREILYFLTSLVRLSDVDLAAGGEAQNAVSVLWHQNMSLIYRAARRLALSIPHPGHDIKDLREIVKSLDDLNPDKPRTIFYYLRKRVHIQPGSGDHDLACAVMDALDAYTFSASPPAEARSEAAAVLRPHYRGQHDHTAALELSLDSLGRFADVAEEVRKLLPDDRRGAPSEHFRNLITAEEYQRIRDLKPVGDAGRAARLLVMSVVESGRLYGYLDLSSKSLDGPVRSPEAFLAAMSLIRERRAIRDELMRTAPKSSTGPPPGLSYFDGHDPNLEDFSMGGARPDILFRERKLELFTRDRALSAEADGLIDRIRYQGIGLLEESVGEDPASVRRAVEVLLLALRGYAAQLEVDGLIGDRVMRVVRSIEEERRPLSLAALTSLIQLLNDQMRHFDAQLVEEYGDYPAQIAAALGPIRVKPAYGEKDVQKLGRRLWSKRVEASFMNDLLGEKRTLLAFRALLQRMFDLLSGLPGPWRGEIAVRPVKTEGYLSGEDALSAGDVVGERNEPLDRVGSKGYELSSLVAAGFDNIPPFAVLPSNLDPDTDPSVFRAAVISAILRIEAESGKQFPFNGRTLSPEEWIHIANFRLDHGFGPRTGQRARSAVPEPLFVSVRSGSVHSMPGVMETVVNLPWQNESLRSLAESSPLGEWFSTDAARMFFTSWGSAINGVDPVIFSSIVDAEKRNIAMNRMGRVRRWAHRFFEAVQRRSPRMYRVLMSVPALEDLRHSTEPDLQSVMIDEFSQKEMEQVLRAIRQRSGFDRPAFRGGAPDPLQQVLIAAKAVHQSWDSLPARAYRLKFGLPDQFGTAVVIQEMVFGNSSSHSGTAVVFSWDALKRQRKPHGVAKFRSQGTNIVGGLTRTSIGISRTGEGDSIEDRYPNLYAAIYDLVRRVDRTNNGAPSDLEITWDVREAWPPDHPALSKDVTQQGIDAWKYHLHLLQTRSLVLSRDRGLRELNVEWIDPAGSGKPAPKALFETRNMWYGRGSSPGAAFGVPVVADHLTLDELDRKIRESRSAAAGKYGVDERMIGAILIFDLFGDQQAPKMYLPGVTGLVSAGIGEANHGSLIANKLGLPYVAAFEEGAVAAGKDPADWIMAIDGTDGLIFLHPIRSGEKMPDFLKPVAAEPEASAVATRVRSSAPMVQLQPVVRSPGAEAVYDEEYDAAIDLLPEVTAIEEIVIVDDTPSTLESSRDQLRKALDARGIGVPIRSFGDAAEADRYVTEPKLFGRIILMDHDVSSDRTGSEYIRSWREAGIQDAIIILSGKKPFTREELYDAVGRTGTAQAHRSDRRWPGWVADHIQRSGARMADLIYGTEAPDPHDAELWKKSPNDREAAINRTAKDGMMRLYIGQVTLTDDGLYQITDPQGLGAIAAAAAERFAAWGIPAALEHYRLGHDTTPTRHFASIEYDYYLAVKPEAQWSVRSILKEALRTSAAPTLEDIDRGVVKELDLVEVVETEGSEMSVPVGEVAGKLGIRPIVNDRRLDRIREYFAPLGAKADRIFLHEEVAPGGYTQEGVHWEKVVIKQHFWVPRKLGSAVRAYLDLPDRLQTRSLGPLAGGHGAPVFRFLSAVHPSLDPVKFDRAFGALEGSVGSWTGFTNKWSWMHLVRPLSGYADAFEGIDPIEVVRSVHELDTVHDQDRGAELLALILVAASNPSLLSRDLMAEIEKTLPKHFMWAVNAAGLMVQIRPDLANSSTVHRMVQEYSKVKFQDTFSLPSGWPRIQAENRNTDIRVSIGRSIERFLNADPKIASDGSVREFVLGSRTRASREPLVYVGADETSVETAYKSEWHLSRMDELVDLLAERGITVTPQEIEIDPETYHHSESHYTMFRSLFFLQTEERYRSIVMDVVRDEVWLKPRQERSGAVAQRVAALSSGRGAPADLADQLSAAGVKEAPDAIFASVYREAVLLNPRVSIGKLHRLYKEFWGRYHHVDADPRYPDADQPGMTPLMVRHSETRLDDPNDDRRWLDGRPEGVVRIETPLLKLVRERLGISEAFAVHGLTIENHDSTRHFFVGVDRELLYVPDRAKDLVRLLVSAGEEEFMNAVFDESADLETRLRRGTRGLGDGVRTGAWGGKEAGFLTLKRAGLAFPPGIVLSPTLALEFVQSDPQKRHEMEMHISRRLRDEGIEFFVKKDSVWHWYITYPDWEPVVLRSNPKVSMPGILTSSGPTGSLYDGARTVVGAWDLSKARAYRERSGLDHHYDQPLIIQKWVSGKKRGFSGPAGKTGDRSDRYASGVMSTRNPDTGAKGIYGRFAWNSTGDELMTKGGFGEDLSTLRENESWLYQELSLAAEKLEAAAGPQETEFVVEGGKIWFVQARPIHFSPQAEIDYLRGMIGSGEMSEARAIPRIESLQNRLGSRKVRRIASASEGPIARAEAFTAGAVEGRLAWDLEEARRIVSNGDGVVLVGTLANRERVLESVFGFENAGLIALDYGNGSSHEAALARHSGIPSLIRIQGAQFVEGEDQHHIRLPDGRRLFQGDRVVLDGDRGVLYAEGTATTELSGAVSDASHGIDVRSFRIDFSAPYLDADGRVRAEFTEARLLELNAASQKKYDALREGPDAAAAFRANLEKHFIHDLLTQRRREDVEGARMAAQIEYSDGRKAHEFLAGGTSGARLTRRAGDEEMRAFALKAVSAMGVRQGVPVTFAVWGGRGKVEFVRAFGVSGARPALSGPVRQDAAAGQGVTAGTSAWDPRMAASLLEGIAVIPADLELPVWTELFPAETRLSELEIEAQMEFLLEQAAFFARLRPGTRFFLSEDVSRLRPALQELVRSAVRRLPGVFVEGAAPRQKGRLMVRLTASLASKAGAVNLAVEPLTREGEMPDWSAIFAVPLLAAAAVNGNPAASEDPQAVFNDAHGFADRRAVERIARLYPSGAFDGGISGPDFLTALQGKRPFLAHQRPLYLMVRAARLLQEVRAAIQQVRVMA